MVNHTVTFTMKLAIWGTDKSWTSLSWIMSATEPGVGSDQDSHATIREGRGADSQGYLGGNLNGIRPNGKVGWKMSNVDNTDPKILKNPCLSIMPLGCQVVFGQLDVGSEATEEATKEDGKEDKDQQEALTPGVPFGCGLYISVPGDWGVYPQFIAVWMRIGWWS